MNPRASTWIAIPVAFVMLVALLLPSPGAVAHGVAMAHVDFREVSADVYVLESRIPSGVKPVGVALSSQVQCRSESRQQYVQASQYIIREWLRCDEAERRLSLEFPETDFDYFLRISQIGVPESARVVSAGSLVVADTHASSDLWRRVEIGVAHILGGLDHLLFIFGLLLLIRGPAQIAGTVTSFTVAHSISLSLAVLGVFEVPSAPVEAFIALSIVYLSWEILRRRSATTTDPVRIPPWVIAFIFGLVHGLGFASALVEWGLPKDELLLTLLLFNLGVEIGQIGFAVTVGLGVWATREVLRSSAAQQKLASATAYGLGAVSCAWLIDRVVAFWS